MAIRPLIVAVQALASLLLVACWAQESSASSVETQEARPLSQTPTAIPTGVAESTSQPLAGWQDELVDLEPGEVCETLREGQFEPYERFFPSPNDADKTIESGWAIGKRSPFLLDPPIDWEHLVSVDRSWNYQLNAWTPLDSILIEHTRSSQPRYISFALELGVDWISKNPYPPPESDSDVEDFGWYDMAVGLRAYRMAYLLEAACRDPSASIEQVSHLWGSLLDHFD